ncbi:cyclase family protein [Alpinimonas psychrophila]|uniref:Kynurenine formamidase n=1 Tax=Alpinimonas psychrophila TaxID=748908 RepID=A0A7W3PNI0_9MICO|nr:cyclase family protein [Alpinimonas psychrophila]MBA8828859.1 kynurenine formamidase [Alpinimonas psychrophila]
MGTINLLQPEQITAASQLVSSGKVIPLAIELNAAGPQPAAGLRQNLIHIMKRTGASKPEKGGFHFMDDIVMIHTHASTQLDALAHVAYDGKLYNGYAVETVTDSGAAMLGIENMAKGIRGRGVLIDLPRFLNRRRLDSDHVISSQEIMECLAFEGIVLRSGDIVLLRTGWLQVFTIDGDREKFAESEPGIGIEAAIWLKENDISFLGGDNWAIEVFPPENPNESMPVHCLLIRDAGMPFGEILDLEELSRECAQHQRWEFFFSCDVLPITGGVGAPIAPVAVF